MDKNTSPVPSDVDPDRSLEVVPDPAFSVRYMDRSVDPTNDFYEYANGGWTRSNPLPADKAIWGAFNELQERNFALIHRILERTQAAGVSGPPGPRRQVGDFYTSAMDTARLELLGLHPLEADRAAIGQIGTLPDLVQVLAGFHSMGVPGLFDPTPYPDLKNSSVYALYLYQGGLALPDRDYYLNEEFSGLRDAYRAHVETMFGLWGQPLEEAGNDAAEVLALEMELAKASRTRTELRDREKNYHRTETADLIAKYPNLHFGEYLQRMGAGDASYVIVGQPEFFAALDSTLANRPLARWKVYLRWNVLHASARCLHGAVESEDFKFFHTKLLGQRQPEPRWRRAAQLVDEQLGEALGQLFVEERYPPEAKERMDEMVRHLRSVFRDRLSNLDWMTAPTRQQALVKFERFVAQIGHPAKFRDYSSVRVGRDDLLGNVRRAASFDVHRQISRLGKTVDRFEWGMTPPTVNAYFDPTQNEIFFPAGILQPPFFDFTLDDAVNYGGIGAVIGHEITHGYDDQGRRSDADGNLRDWWTAQDEVEFTTRAKKVVELYEAHEPLPGLHVNGELTLGENIADFGGVSLAFEALQRRLAEHPESRREIDGLTPEQRFFISWAQIWRTNCSEAEERRRLTIDGHAPGQYRAVTPLVNLAEFYEAFRAPGRSPPPSDQLVRIW